MDDETQPCVVVTRRVSARRCGERDAGGCGDVLSLDAYASPKVIKSVA